MTNFDHVIEHTQKTLDKNITSHPIINHLMSGQMTTGEYLSYLTETYHMVKHTSRMLALAAAKLDEHKRGLRDWFIEQTEEENSHDLFCIKDVKHLGFKPEDIFRRAPLSGSWGLITQNYYMATYGNPAGILGVASLTEGLGATLAGNLATVLVEQYNIPANAVTFLKSHSGFDARHLEDCKRAINELITDNNDIDAIIHGRNMTIINYAQMFTDVLENPIDIRELSSAA